MVFAMHPDRIGERIVRRSLDYAQDELYGPEVHTEEEDHYIYHGMASRKLGMLRDIVAVVLILSVKLYSKCLC